MMRNLVISVHEHPHGDVLRVHASAEDAQARKAQIARDYWRGSMDGEPPADDVEAATRYFDAAEDRGECFNIHTVETGELVFRIRAFWNPEDPWEAHSRFSREAWAHEVGSDSTSLGYIDWVNSMIEDEQAELREEADDVGGPPPVA